ncbi:MAG: type IV pilus twitching motility protein PilT [Patescibacteria group bacterium]|nr:type IV pilus twitching motility protein PilT [Patescibacteria group bacterium]
MALKLDKIFRTAVQYKASDVYIITGSKPVLRINGELVKIDDHPVLTKKMAEDYLLEIMTEDQKKKFEKTLDLDFSIDVENTSRFRVNMYVQRKGIAASFRTIPATVYTMAELGLPEQLKSILKMRQGLVLLTGATGTGKSTTLSAMINEINDTQKNHIITIEDPIEFIHENKQSVVDQREVGNHTTSFAKALRASMREDPDIILIGEMRDLETIELALKAAETGHLVFGTLHTSGAANSVDRIINVFPFEQQNQIRTILADSLKAVVWQTLCKTKDGKGRISALEIMFVNNAIANMIRKGKTHQINSAIETGTREGMQTMKKAVMDMLQADLITEEEALSKIPKQWEEDINPEQA